VTPDQINQLIATVQRRYRCAVDHRVWHQALAEDSAHDIDEGAAWWFEHHPDRPPSPADLRWAKRTQLNPNVKDQVAAARAAIRNAKPYQPEGTPT